MVNSCLCDTTNEINGYDNHARNCSIDLCIGSRLGHVKVGFTEMLDNFKIESE